ncbi:MAG: mercuric transporter MerT family protein [Alphaproteobacteria bacterium]|nr:mercuric transporter MerT family protein [Alphaproteobacteria bacterium]
MKDKFPIIGSIIASVTAVIGASCCVIPLVLFNLGIGGAWVSNITVLQPFRPYLIAVSILALAIGGYVYWRNCKSACEPCEDTPKQKTGMVILTIVAVLLTGIAIIWPQIEPDLIRAIR